MEKGKLYVMDTSAIMSRKINLLSDNLVFPDRVIEEIRKGRLKYMLDVSEEMIRVFAPSKESVEAVKEASKKTRDFSVLSETDIEVLASGYELKAAIITDDYAVQNVASSLGIEWESTDVAGISKEIVWKYRCTGCRKVFSRPLDTCPVCGHEVRRFHKTR